MGTEPDGTRARSAPPSGRPASRAAPQSGRPAARLVHRERLLEVLRRRHRRRLIVLEAPPGFGRTTLLAQALEEGPRHPDDVDLQVTIRPGDVVRLADLLVPVESDDGRQGQRAVLVDDAHLAVDRGEIAALVEAMPEDLHLVIAVRQGRTPGLAAALARDGAELIAARDLAFDDAERRELGVATGWSSDAALLSWPALARLAGTGEERLVLAFLRDEVAADLDPRTVDVLAALADVGGGGAAFVDQVLERFEADEQVRRELNEAPLAQVTESGCRPHALWATATRGRLPHETRDEIMVLAVDDRRSRGDLVAAGTLAREVMAPRALAAVVRDALATSPPLVGRPVLLEWFGSGLLAPTEPEAHWLDGALAAQAGDPERGKDQLENARAAFEAAGDLEAESQVLLHLGVLARRTDDLGLLMTLVGHAARLGAVGSPIGASLSALGRAVAAALNGDPHEAVRVLEEGPMASLQGDWEGQLHMVLGTNLALVGRDDDAVRSLTRATGVGSAASRSTAENLLATTLWSTGEWDEALAAAGRSCELARQAEAPSTSAQALAMRALLGTLGGDPDAGRMRQHLDTLEHHDGEAHEIAQLCRSLVAVQEGDLDTARRALETLPPPTRRPTRAKIWRAALEVALLPGGDERWRAVDAEEGYLARAVAAGSAGADHLATGAEPAPEHLPFLPSCWWPGRPGVVDLRLLGGAAVHGPGGTADMKAWNRGRVRELALHLTLCTDVGRDAVASALWPDHDEAAARGNLRVTLSYLLDVIDPDRVRGQSSPLLVVTDGRLHFADDPRLRIDIRQQGDLARRVAAAAAAGDVAAALAAARRLARMPGGPVLGGVSVGEWAEGHCARFDELMARARRTAAGLALAGGDPELAGDLADQMIAADPWSEAARQLKVEAHLAAGDLDQARRDLDASFTMLAELGLAPTPRTQELARQVGGFP